MRTPHLSETSWTEFFLANPSLTDFVVLLDIQVWFGGGGGRFDVVIVVFLRFFSSIFSSWFCFWWIVVVRGGCSPFFRAGCGCNSGCGRRCSPFRRSEIQCGIVVGGLFLEFLNVDPWGAEMAIQSFCGEFVEFLRDFVGKIESGWNWNSQVMWIFGFSPFGSPAWFPRLVSLFRVLLSLDYFNLVSVGVCDTLNFIKKSLFR